MVPIATFLDDWLENGKRNPAKPRATYAHDYNTVRPHCPIHSSSTPAEPRFDDRTNRNQRYPVEPRPE